MSENEQERTPEQRQDVSSADSAPQEQGLNPEPTEVSSANADARPSPASIRPTPAAPRPKPVPRPSALRPSPAAATTTTPSAAAPSPAAPSSATPSAAAPARPAEDAGEPATPLTEGGTDAQATSSSAGAVEAAVVAPAALDPRAVERAKEYGRVDDEGNVYVREGENERRVGQVPGATGDDAMEIFIRRYIDLDAQVALLETRAATAALKDVDQSLTTLQQSLTEPAAVGDLAALATRVEAAAATVAERKEKAAAERAAAKAAALAERETVVEQAEAVAAQDPARTQWKQSGEKLRVLLGTWQQMQRSGPRLDRSAEDALWKRFSHARGTFDRHRRQFFSELDAKQGEVKKIKEQLIARAEELSNSTDWGRTSGEYRRLMDEWKAAGRASRKEDDALWARFRAVQQIFFDARSQANAEIDAQFQDNLKVKEQILLEAEALVPVRDITAAKSALRTLQDRWEEAGKVPRADIQRMEGRMRKVEMAIRDAEQAEWQRSNPETQARADGMAAQLEASLVQLEEELEAARAKGDDSAAKSTEDALIARRAWLEQVRAAQN